MSVLAKSLTFLDVIVALLVMTPFVVMVFVLAMPLTFLDVIEAVLFMTPFVVMVGAIIIGSAYGSSSTKRGAIGRTLVGLAGAIVGTTVARHLYSQSNDPKDSPLVWWLFGAVLGGLSAVLLAKFVSWCTRRIIHRKDEPDAVQLEDSR